MLIISDGLEVVICKDKKTKGLIGNVVYHFEGCSVVSVTCSSSTFYDLFIHLLCICVFVYFRDYLFLFVIFQISSALTQGRHIRKLAIRVLRNMLVKHELDDRYEGEVSSN